MYLIKIRVHKILSLPKENIFVTFIVAFLLNTYKNTCKYCCGERNQILIINLEKYICNPTSFAPKNTFLMTLTSCIRMYFLPTLLRL